MEAERCEDGTPLPEEVEGPPVDLSMDLIKRSLLTSEELQSKDADAIAEMILQCRSLHLEWQNIGTIDNLESFTGLEELYLQYNRIQRIENLDNLESLVFLSLSGNKIKKLENLSHLRKLKVLDLAQNEIEHIETDEIPRSVVFLKLEGNPCCSAPEFYEQLFHQLPSLKVLIFMLTLTSMSSYDEWQAGEAQEHLSQEKAVDRLAEQRSSPESSEVTDDLIEKLLQQRDDLIKQSLSELSSETEVREATRVLKEKREQIMERSKQRIADFQDQRTRYTEAVKEQLDQRR